MAATKQKTRLDDFIQGIDSRLYKEHARTYILEMLAGKKPDTRPDVGPEWELLVDILEQKYAKFGNIPMAVMEDMCRQNPALADLLKFPLQGDVESVNELGFPELPRSAQLPPELSKGACPQLDIHVAHSRKASPESYDDIHAFTGLWAFSGISNRRVYLPLGEDTFFTNLIIQQCGMSTFFAKSLVAKIAQSMLKRAGLDFFLFTDRRITPQKLLLEMAGQVELENYLTLSANEQEQVKQQVAFAGQKILYFDEFGKMLKEILGNKNPTMSVYEQIFLTIYNCPDTYSNGTVIRGMSPITNPFLSILGSMTPPNLRLIARAGAESWQDGLFARSLFICPPEDAIKDETLKFERLSTPPELIRDIHNWHNRLGSPEVEITIETKGNSEKPVVTPLVPLPQHQCTFDPKVQTAFVAYRVALRQLARSTSVPKDLATNYGRLPENAMKFAMIMASLSNNNHIEMCHWARAQELAEALRRNLHELYAQVNTSNAFTSRSAQLQGKILETLKKHGAMTLSLLWKNHLRAHDIKEIETALKGLKRIGQVTEFSTSQSVKYQFVEQLEDE